MTHTFVELEMSAAAYDEIAAKLREAGYDHAFMKDIAGATGKETIDLHGIGVTKGAAEQCPNCVHLAQMLETKLDGEQGIHVSTGGRSRDEKLFSARDVQAFTAIGFALRKKHDADRVTREREPPHCSTCSCGMKGA
jgi:hypothetical protein